MRWDKIKPVVQNSNAFFCLLPKPSLTHNHGQFYVCGSWEASQAVVQEAQGGGAVQISSSVQELEMVALLRPCATGHDPGCLWQCWGGQG